MRGERDLYRDKIEVSLDGKQVFYLFFGGAVIASLVFVVGVMIGKRLEARAHGERADIAETLPSDPLAALDMLAAGGQDDLSFPSELRQPRADAPVSAGAAGKVADADTGKAKVDAKAADAKLKADAAAKLKLDVEKAKAKAAADAKLKADARAMADSKAKATADAKAKAKAKADAKAAGKAKAKSGKFTLQLSSFQSESEAEAFYDQLRAAGYKPFISRAEVPGKGTWYRVRLGKYPTYEDAVTAKATFEKRQKIIAYVTRIR